jgi:hypothetical protein
MQNIRTSAIPFLICLHEYKGVALYCRNVSGGWDTIQNKCQQKFTVIQFPYIPPLPTIAITMEVKVELLWTATVPKMPIIRPTTGLDIMELSERKSPKRSIN